MVSVPHTMRWPPIWIVTSPPLESAWIWTAIVFSVRSMMRVTRSAMRTRGDLPKPVPSTSRRPPRGASRVRSVHVGPGYRVYFAQQHGTMVLLCGGAKSTQARDIERARRILTELDEG